MTTGKENFLQLGLSVIGPVQYCMGKQKFQHENNRNKARDVPRLKLGEKLIFLASFPFFLARQRFSIVVTGGVVKFLVARL